MEDKEIKNEKKFRSTRHAADDIKTPLQLPLRSPPRLGRRESEPHSASISYLHDVLKTNFPQHRVMWDLHHYFHHPDEIIDLQFDISLFLNFQIAEQLPSYDAAKYQGRVPDVVINILSKSTWKNDLLEHVTTCELLGIPFYIVFFAYEVSSRFYKLPFLRVYQLQESGKYTQTDLTQIMYEKGQATNKNAFIPTSSHLPFDIALELLDEKYLEGKEIYQIVLLEAETQKRFLEAKDQEKSRADQEKTRADQEKSRADQEKTRADQEKSRADKFKQELQTYRDKFGDLS